MDFETPAGFFFVIGGEISIVPPDSHPRAAVPPSTRGRAAIHARPCRHPRAAVPPSTRGRAAIEVLKDVRVCGSELEATRIGVRNDQAVEWIARPRQIVRFVEPRGGGWLVDGPSVVVRELERRDLKAYATKLCEKLDLE